MTMVTFAEFFKTFFVKEVFGANVKRRGTSNEVVVLDSVRAFQEKVEKYKDQEQYFVSEILSRTDSMLMNLEDGKLLSCVDVAKSIAFSLGCGIDFAKEAEEYVKEVVLRESSNNHQSARYYVSSKKRNPGVALWDKRVKF